MKPGRDPLILAVFLALAVGFYFYSNYPKSEGSYTSARVLDVIDGDTIIIDDAKRSHVRYLGIDTPEAAHQDSPGDPLSAEAKGLNEMLVRGKEVRLEFDEEKYDVYGRLLAYVFVGDTFVSGEMLREGLATPLVIDPNRKYGDVIMSAAEEGRRRGKGMWGDLSRIGRPPGSEEFVIDISRAPRYEGKRVVVRGKVIGVRKSEKVLVLNLDGGFEVVIFPDDWDNFSYFGIDPAADYEGKDIEVTGRVRMHRGSPGMIVDHPMLIRSPG